MNDCTLVGPLSFSIFKQLAKFFHKKSLCYTGSYGFVTKFRKKSRYIKQSIYTIIVNRFIACRCIYQEA